MISTTHVPAIHLGFELATNMGGVFSSIFRGSASTVSTESESDSYSTIAGTTETTPQSIPNPASPGASSGCPKPDSITMRQKDLVHKDPLAAFHLHKTLQDVDGGCLMPDEQCKRLDAEVSEWEEEAEELGVLLISGSDDSGSDSGSEDLDTDLEDQVSGGTSDYSPLPDSPAPGDEEPDYPSIGRMHMIIQQATTDYLLDFERRKYKAKKHARTQRYSMTCSRTKALVFTAYDSKSGSGDRLTDESSPQGAPRKDQEIFMKAWRKNQERTSKGSGKFLNLFDNDEEAAYEADDDSG